MKQCKDYSTPVVKDLHDGNVSIPKFMLISMYSAVKHEFVNRNEWRGRTIERFTDRINSTDPVIPKDLKAFKEDAIKYIDHCLTFLEIEKFVVEELELERHNAEQEKEPNEL